MEIEIKNTMQSLKVRFESWFLFNSVKSIAPFDTIKASADSDTFSFIKLESNTFLKNKITIFLHENKIGNGTYNI